jgi:uncharacterized protein
MKDRLDPRSLPVRDFSELGAELEGSTPLASLRRLCASACEAPPAGEVAEWLARGRLVSTPGTEPESWLHLQGQATITLECQRCLRPMSQLLKVDREFRFVATEAQAEALDEWAEEDVMVLPPRLDLTGLLEDELILSLPLVPRHEPACPEPLLAVDRAELPGGAAADAPHPFAALAALRTQRRSDPE